MTKSIIVKINKSKGLTSEHLRFNIILKSEQNFIIIIIGMLRFNCYLIVTGIILKSLKLIGQFLYALIIVNSYPLQMNGRNQSIC